MFLSNYQGVSINVKAPDPYAQADYAPEDNLQDCVAIFVQQLQVISDAVSPGCMKLAHGPQFRRPSPQWMITW
jgi:hypothetical protein